MPFLKASTYVLITLSSLMLSACGPSIQTKNNSSFGQAKTLTANEHFKLGKDHYTAWLDSELNISNDLAKADFHLGQALKAQPDNILFQLNYYNAHITSLSSFESYDEQAALKLFNTLHPAIQSEAITPAFVSFNYSTTLKQSNKTQLKHILRATQQNPENPQNWFYLSRTFQAEQQYWLAAASAAISQKISPSTPAYSYEFAKNLASIAYSDHCPDNRKALTVRAAKLFSQAAITDNKNALYLAASSEAYLRLGINPLALAQAKLAYQQSPNAITAKSLFDALFFNSQFNEAWEILDVMQTELKLKPSLFLGLKNWYYNKEARKLDIHTGTIESMMLSNTPEHSHFSFLASPLFIPPTKQKLTEMDDEKPFHLNKNDRIVFSFVTSNDQTDHVDFLNKEGTECEKDRRQFYSAGVDRLNTPNLNWQEAFKKSRIKENRLRAENYWQFLLSRTSEY